MIPKFENSGLLPAGIYLAEWDELTEVFGWTGQREWLLQGLRLAMEALASAGCRTIYIDGSFVTQKDCPNDYDGCWDTSGVDLSKLDPVFRDFSNKRYAQKLKYRGEFFPANLAESGSGKTFLDFFQTDKETGNPKGIVSLKLNGGV